MNKVYDVINDRIMAALDKGIVPWRQPWNGGLEPQNMVTRRGYRGVNLWMLSAAPYPTPFYLTYRQASQLGGQVRKGESGWPVIYMRFSHDKDEQGKETRSRIMRYYTVFNVAQCDGITPPSLDLPEFVPIEEAERVVREMPQRPPIRHESQKACYYPLLDYVNMPIKESFSQPAEYYSTLFHELAHSTGHATRLDRKLVGGFGGRDYSKEELIAEMAAAYLCSTCRIEHATLDNSANYIGGWLRSLKNDRTMLISAASMAQKAADFILRRKHEEGTGATTGASGEGDTGGDLPGDREEAGATEGATATADRPVEHVS
jgi:antirestriction protein ArdC